MLLNLVRGVEEQTARGVYESVVSTNTAGSLSEYASRLSTGDQTVDLYIILGIAGLAAAMLVTLLFCGGSRATEPDFPLVEDFQHLKKHIEFLSNSASNLISLRDSQIEFLKQELLLIREELQLQREVLEDIMRKNRPDTIDFSKGLVSSPQGWQERAVDLDAVLSGRAR